MKNNAVQTAEDNFQKDNIKWIMSLRPIAPSSMTTRDTKSKQNDDIRARTPRDDGEDGGQGKPLFIQNPPSFYEQDLQKWDKKFEGSINNR